jgi:disease resistance protein RPM1
MLTKEDGDHHGRIVSIAGFGGLGKTTLAKAVYDEIKGRFGSTAFVSVSRNPNMEKLLKDMLYELHKGRQHPAGASLDDVKQLIDLVREFLKNQRYVPAMTYMHHVCLSIHKFICFL